MEAPALQVAPQQQPNNNDDGGGGGAGGDDGLGGMFGGGGDDAAAMGNPLTWERIFGLDGTMAFLEHALWLIALNIIFLLIFGEFSLATSF